MRTDGARNAGRGHPPHRHARDRLVVRATTLAALPRKPDGKTHFLRVLATYDVDAGWTVRSAGAQRSHQLAAMAAANALAVLPDGEGAAQGTKVPTILLSSGSASEGLPTS